jgi:acetyl-CoA carboxylase biotin carboxylase subunit
MERALEEFIIEGVKTTVPFHKQLMKDPNFRSGNFHTGYLNDFEFEGE